MVAACDKLGMPTPRTEGGEVKVEYVREPIVVRFTNEEARAAARYAQTDEMTAARVLAYVFEERARAALANAEASHDAR